MERKATAVWQGGLRDGKGTLTTESKVLSNTPYSFSTRFESSPGTNPEELLGAAHAGCFAMALSLNLGEAGIKPEMIEEATKNARAVAEKFAADSDSRLGKIRSAQQGQFTIENRDSTTPHIKKVRVVSTVEYHLAD
jgi:OsmC subfamily peroxiredoxin